VEEAPFVLDDLIKLWLLAGRLGNAQLCDCVIDAMLSVADDVSEDVDWTEAILAETIELIYAATTEGRSLRRLVVDFYAADADPPQLWENESQWHPEFINDIKMEYGRPDDDYYNDGRISCYYHEHMGPRIPLCMCPFYASETEQTDQE
jgi:hypothetical protein